MCVFDVFNSFVKQILTFSVNLFKQLIKHSVAQVNIWRIVLALPTWIKILLLTSFQTCTFWKKYQLKNLGSKSIKRYPDMGENKKLGSGGFERLGGDDQICGQRKKNSPMGTPFYCLFSFKVFLLILEWIYCSNNHWCCISLYFFW